jgi:hypothetical protein
VYNTNHTTTTTPHHNNNAQLMTERFSTIDEGSTANGVVIDGCTIKDGIPLCSRHSWEMHSDDTLSLPATTITKVTIFNLSDWDHDGMVSLANNNVVIPTTGRYFVNFMTFVNSSGVNLTVYYYVNDVVRIVGRQATGPVTNRPWDNFSAILELTAGDVLDVRMNPAVAGVTIGSANSFEWARMHGFFIG